jgi:adenylylsulfate kinase-like enzyme
MVIWITGMSASGKTTLSHEFKSHYKNEFKNIVLLDGDIVRELYGNDLNYKEEDRIKQIIRLQKIAAFLEKQDLIVLVAALYSNNELLENNKKIFKEYFEIYLKGTIEELQQREFKGLYKNALSNKIKDVVGIDIKWHEPQQPNLIFKLSEGKSPLEMAKIMYSKIFLKK